MQVRILEEVLKSDGYNLVNGDIATVTHEIGVRWCGQGWSEDISGAVKTGARNVSPVQIQPNKITNANKVKEA